MNHLLESCEYRNKHKHPIGVKFEKNYNIAPTKYLIEKYDGYKLLFGCDSTPTYLAHVFISYPRIHINFILDAG